MKQLVLPTGSREGSLVELKDQEHHYLTRVRRVAVGDQIAGLTSAHRLELEVVSITSQTIVLMVTAEQVLDRNDRTEITLFPFLLKGGKLDDVVRQACEAGVRAIIPVEGEHCIARLETDSDAERKTKRWSSIAKEAAQQSGNTTVCEVHRPIPAMALLESWTGSDPLLFFHQTPLDKSSLHRYLFPRPARVGLIVGPEGGLSEAEVNRFQSRGAKPVWLGPFVLRAETASLYAVAAVNTLLQEATEWTIPT